MPSLLYNPTAPAAGGFGDDFRDLLRGSAPSLATREARASRQRSPYGYRDQAGFQHRGGVATPLPALPNVPAVAPVQTAGKSQAQVQDIYQQIQQTPEYYDSHKRQDDAYRPAPDRELIANGVAPDLARRRDLSPEAVKKFQARRDARKAEMEKRRQRGFANKQMMQRRADSLQQMQTGNVFNPDGSADLLGSMAAQLMGRGQFGEAVQAGGARAQTQADLARTMMQGNIAQGQQGLQGQELAAQNLFNMLQAQDNARRTSYMTDPARDESALAIANARSGASLDPATELQAQELERSRQDVRRAQTSDRLSAPPEVQRTELASLIPELEGLSGDPLRQRMNELGVSESELRQASEYAPWFPSLGEVDSVDDLTSMDTMRGAAGRVLNPLTWLFGEGLEEGRARTSQQESFREILERLGVEQPTESKKGKKGGKTRKKPRTEADLMSGSVTPSEEAPLTEAQRRFLERLNTGYAFDPAAF